MSELTMRARQLVQLLAEELDKTQAPWAVLMSGDGETFKAWDLRVETGEGDDEDWYVSNTDTNKADIIPITRLSSDG